MEIVLSTRNVNKLNEIRGMFSGTGMTIRSLNSFPDFPEVVEDGASFEENALKKARALAAYAQRVTIADDSGIEVAFLNGSPGIFSARFAGATATDQMNNQKLLQELIHVPMGQRQARFRCVIAIVSPDGREQTVEGICSGFIAENERGANGFGYDPVFIHPETGLTFGQMTPEFKNSISHRARAVEQLKRILPEFLNMALNPPCK